MSYEAWRISFQDSEQAAKAAFAEAQRYERLFASVIMALVGVGEAAGVRGEDQLNGNLEILIAIEKLKERRDKWKAQALEAVEERDALAAHIERITGLCRDLDECELGSESMADVWGEIEDTLISQPANSLAKRDAAKQAAAVNEFAKEVWEEIFKHYRNIKVYPLTMAKQWIKSRTDDHECSDCEGLGQIAKVTCPICDGRGRTSLSDSEASQ